jgi:arylformamidase
MKIHDITLSIEPGMLVWPGDPPVALRQVSSIQNGADSNVSQLRMSVHTGTHIDAPKHFIDSGDTIDQIPVEKLLGDVLVLRFNDEITTLSKQTLLSHPQSGQFGKFKKILFHTHNSSIYRDYPSTFQTDYVGIDTSGAEYLAQFNFDLIGVDYLSIAPFHDTHKPHEILLSNGVVLLEGIDLSSISEGIYQLFCMPLNLKGSEGAPARVILIENEVA